MLKKLNRTVSVLLIVAMLLFSGCGEKRSQSADRIKKNGKTLRVITTFYPTKYFTERIAGEAAEVTCPLPPDADPLHWMPDRKAISSFQKADLVVLNGANLEKWIEKASLPSSKTVVTTESFEKDLIRYENRVKHTHGPRGEHAHQGIDAHTWLDPVLARKQAKAILVALKKKVPELSEQFDQNFNTLRNDLLKLHNRFKTLSDNYEGPPLLANHPAFNYLARRYGWNVINFDLPPEKKPGKKKKDRLREVVKAQKSKCLLWETEPVPDVRNFYKQTYGLQSVVVSPCEMLSEAEQKKHDFLAVMNQNVDRLKPVFTSQ